MVSYGPWVQAVDQVVETDYGTGIPDFGQAQGANVPFERQHTFAEGPIPPGEIDAYVHQPIQHAQNGGGIGGVTWRMTYTIWANSPGVDPPGPTPPGVYSVTGAAAWHFRPVVDANTDSRQSDLATAAMAAAPNAVGLEWHPDDADGRMHDRELVVYPDEGAGSYRDQRLIADGTRETTPVPMTDPGTATALRLVHPSIYPLGTLLGDSGGEVPVKDGWAGPPLDNSPGGPTPFELINTHDPADATIERHAQLGQVPAGGPGVGSGSVPIPDGLFDAYALPTILGSRGVVVAVAPATLIVPSTAGDGWTFRFTGDRYQDFIAQARYVFRGQWTPPRYRLVYAGVQAPCRVFPRDDGQATAAAGRVWPPPRSQQGSPRRGPGSYW